jgi:hypothetical protein
MAEVNIEQVNQLKKSDEAMKALSNLKSFGN